MDEFKIEMGKQVRDSITGFTGTVTGRCAYITGCLHYLVTPKGKPNKMEDEQWLDEERLLAQPKRGRPTAPKRKRRTARVGGPAHTPPPSRR